ncbi:MAG: hypothetical protein ACXW12_14565 [Burkholderiales bacterium]
MFAPREVERVESRALAALRFVDSVNGTTVDAPLAVTAPAGTLLFRNRSGLYVVGRHAALAEHESAFRHPPDTPALGSVTLDLSVSDPGGTYLGRALRLALPRDPRPENVDAVDSLFRPVECELYRSPAAAVGANWAAVRVTVTESASGDALGGSLLRVVSGGRTLARGLSDWRGEALVPVAGVPITTWSEDEDAVIVTEIDATLEILFDASAGSTRTPAAALVARRPPSTLPAPDPDAIESNPAAARTSLPIRLAASRLLALAMHLDLPG